MKNIKAEKILLNYMCNKAPNLKRARCSDNLVLPIAIHYCKVSNWAEIRENIDYLQKRICFEVRFSGKSDQLAVAEMRAHESNRIICKYTYFSMVYNIISSHSSLFGCQRSIGHLICATSKGLFSLFYLKVVVIAAMLY